MESLAKLFVLGGVVLLVVGGLMWLGAKAGIVPGRLPGDITVRSGNTTCLIGLGTSLLLSVILTVLLNVIIRILRK